MDRLGILALASASAPAFGVFGLVGAGCSSQDSGGIASVGTFEAGPADPDGGASDCRACLEQACAGPWAVCFSGSEPVAAGAAYAACNGAQSQCAGSCTPAQRTTAGWCGDPNDAGELDGAGDASVIDAGSDAEAGPGPSVSACQACVASACGQATQLCALGSECTAFLGCAYGCTDASCVDACGNSHASGRTGALELSSCTLTSCRSACGL